MKNNKKKYENENENRNKITIEKTNEKENTKR